MSVNIHVNGAPRTVPAGTTLKALLATIGLDRDGIAVAVDRLVVPRSEHATREVTEGARVEVIRAVGGG